MYISSVSSDNLSNDNICGWIISPLLMQNWGEALHFPLADFTSYAYQNEILDAAVGYPKGTTKT